MKLLFYAKSEKGDVISYKVHINEILSGLDKLGNSVVLADGQRYVASSAPTVDSGQKISETKSWLRPLKKIVLASPFRNGMLIIWDLLKEVSLFSSAFLTAQRYKPDIIYGRHELCNSQWLLGRLRRIPSIVEVNGLIIDESKVDNDWHWDKLALKVIDKLERFGFVKSNTYIAVTPILKRVLIDDYHLPEQKIFVLENGANTDLFKPIENSSVKKQLNLKINDNYICFVGMLYRWTKIDYLINIMPLILKDFPDTNLLIVGEGVIHNDLVALSHQLDIQDHVTFAGRVSYDKVPLYINASEICIGPLVGLDSPPRSGASSLKICEYLACGKPVVSSRISGLDFIEESSYGYLVDSAEKLGQAIIALLGNPALRQRMGENGRKYVLENRSWESIAKKTAEICRNAIGEKRKGQ